MMLLPDPNVLQRAERTSETRQSAPRRSRRRPPRHFRFSRLPPRDVVPLPRPRTREERYGTELERSA
jgi:hypothetical protein